MNTASERHASAPKSSSELTAFLTDNLRVDTALGYVEPEYTSSDPVSPIDFTRQAFTHVPETTGNITLSYTHQLNLGGRMELVGSTTYTDSQWAQLDRSFELSSYTITDLTAAYIFPDEKVKVSAYVKNLTDEEYNRFGTIVGVYQVNYGVALPRTYGAEIRYSF